MLSRYSIFVLISLLSLQFAIAQKTLKVISTTGTGQTTGHIATLTVRNNTEETIEVAPDVFYIPSSGRYQSYVGRIPEGILIPPGATVDIPVSGYCADIHTPPVPAGTSTGPVEDFVTVGTPHPPGDGLVTIFPTPPVPPFQADDIPQLTNSPGYRPTRPDQEATYVATWPIPDADQGSTIPVGGTIDPNRDPSVFGPVIVAAVQEIERTTTIMQDNGQLNTPFSGNPPKERESVIQQTFWLYSALLTGEPYYKEDFAENVYEQFENQTGKPVSSLPEEDKERLDSGVDDFWGTFTAVGLEAKVISQPKETTPTPVPVSEPTQTTEEKTGGCDYEMMINMDPPFEFEMKIAEEWGDAEERQEIKDNVGRSLSQDVNLTTEGAFVTYDISSNPTSSTAFWKSGHIGGFASAYAKTNFERPDGSNEWVWGTDRMDTDAGGTMDYTMTYTHDETCRAMVAGTAVIRVRASSSAFDPVASNTESQNDTDQLDVVWWTQFFGKEATNWLVARGRGRTNSSFQRHMRDQIQEHFQGELTDALEQQMLELAEHHLGGALEELGLGGLSLEDLELPDFELPNLQELFEEATGIEIPDFEGWLSDGINAAWNLPFVANTYATANGILNVTVGGNEGRAQANTSVYYSRQGTETTSEAVHWSGTDCQEAIVSDAQADALTIRTIGRSNMVAEAMSRFGFGNGHADATLESMNLQILTGICICPGRRMTDDTTYELSVEGNLGWYSGSDENQQAMTDALEPFLNSLRTDLTDDLDALSRNELENLSTDQFEGMVAEKVQKWAADNPFVWQPCGE